MVFAYVASEEPSAKRAKPFVRVKANSARAIAISILDRYHAAFLLSVSVSNRRTTMPSTEFPIA